MKKSRVNVIDIIIYALLAIIVVICLYPFLNVIAYSLSGNTAVLSGKVSFYPIDAQLTAYREILLKQSQIWSAMGVSVTVTVLGTALGLVLTIAAAYALSKKKLKGRVVISGFILFTMYFNGGIIPTFLVVKNLGLYDKLGALIIPSAMNVFNFIVMRTFFRELPVELEEAAHIDGANDLKVLFSVVLPLSVPIIATIGLFYAVTYWNDYFSSLLYIQTPEKFSMQLRLRQLLFASQLNQVSMENLGTQVMSESLKMASIVISTIPIIIVYPWLQKYFVKGVMLGSVKG
jgi:ABC-type sugar transport system, permease component